MNSDNSSGSVCVSDPESFGRAAIAHYYARHAAADDLQHNSAGFAWNRAARAFQIEVRGYIVAEVATMPEVIAFCLMHNSRITLNTRA